ncbi:MAG: translation initiation factor IF-2 [Candidatus Altiarchaeota archaeon]
MAVTREPIISVLGHVDHGKTTILDFIRESVIASREAGGITQHIGATDIPFEVIERVCGKTLDKSRIRIPIRGLLFIDTPGHEAFTNLRKRGGNVADLAILVVDINEGLMPQTLESIEILKQYKTPFIIAANKIDAIRGWMDDVPFKSQHEGVRKEFNDKFYRLVGDMSMRGLECEMYDRISDFTKQIAVIPVSGKTGEGIPGLLKVLIGLAQTYLAKELSVEITTPAKGTILEVKETKGLGTTVDAIIYDGIIRVNDMIVVGAREPIVTKVKALLRPRALDEMRDPRKQFKHAKEVYAASGVKIVAQGLEDALPGGPVYVGGQELVEKVREEIGEIEFSKDSVGVVIKADTLGTLEALVKILTANKIPVRRGGIGKVSRSDIVEAESVSQNNKYLGVVMAFNSEVLPAADATATDRNVKVIEGKVIYSLIEDYEKWVEEQKAADKAEMVKTVATPCKFRILKAHTFRQSKPAIVGVEVLAGTLHVGSRLLRDDGKVFGKIRGMQESGEKIDEAKAGDRIAVSIDSVMVGRHFNEDDTLYTFISMEDFDALKQTELSDEEKQILREVREIKKKRSM